MKEKCATKIVARFTGSGKTVRISEKWTGVIHAKNIIRSMKYVMNGLRKWKTGKVFVINAGP